MGNIKEVIFSRFRNYIEVFLLLLVIALISIIVLILDTPEWVNTLANSTLGAVIGASLVDLACAIASGKEAEDDMRKGILETLCPARNKGEKPRLYTLYKKPAVEPLLKECLLSYCADEKLSTGYFSYIANSCRHIKKNEKYNVFVEKRDSGELWLEQKLKHTSVYIPDFDKPSYIQMYFIFKDRADRTDHKGHLDEIMNDKSYFFREDLTDDTFVQELIDDLLAAEPHGRDEFNNAALSKLGFSVDLFKDEFSNNPLQIANEDYMIELDSVDCIVNGVREKIYYGLKIKAYIPSEYVKPCDQFYEEEGFVQYTACMKTSYRIPSCQNTFYVVYAMPTMNPSFEIRFDMGSSSFARNVDYMTFMSIDQSVGPHDADDGVVRNHGSSLSFSTRRTVFPRSGISFTWDA